MNSTSNSVPLNRYTALGQTNDPLVTNDSIRYIYNQVVFRLGDFKYNGRPVVPSINMINQAIRIASDQYEPVSANPTSFNIYQPGDEYDPNVIIERAIKIIVNDIYNTYSINQINYDTFSAWNTVLGDYNPVGIRQYSDIRLNHKRVSDVYASVNL
jgi:hypothetical protein